MPRVQAKIHRPVVQIDPLIQPDESLNDACRRLQPGYDSWDEARKDNFRAQLVAAMGQQQAAGAAMGNLIGQMSGWGLSPKVETKAETSVVHTDALIQPGESLDDACRRLQPAFDTWDDARKEDFRGNLVAAIGRQQAE